MIHRNFVDKPEINFPYNSTILIIFEKSISYSGNFESYHIVFNAFNLLRVSDAKNSLYLSEKVYPSCTPQKIKVLLFISSLFFFINESVLTNQEPPKFKNWKMIFLIITYYIFYKSQNMGGPLHFLSAAPALYNFWCIRKCSND